MKPLAPLDIFARFNEDLAELSRLGLPLERALEECAKGLPGGAFRRGILSIEAGLREGKSLEEAVRGAGATLPAYYGALMQAGVRSGNLPAVLSAVARQSEISCMADRAVRQALAYPLLVLGVALLLTLSFLGMAVPFFRQHVLEGGLKPPFTVEAAIHLVEHPALGAGVGFLLLGTGFMGVRAVGRLPWLRRIQTHLRSARFLGSLSVLLRAGTPLPEALDLALRGSGDDRLEAIRSRVTALAADGASLSSLLGHLGPAAGVLEVHVRIAERGGGAAGAVADAAELAADLARAESEDLVWILVPPALLVAGAGVGGLVCSLIAPYFEYLVSLSG
jgi:type IV pilus assembly protein PilC